MRGVVTGASRGLGFELVKLGLEKGHFMLAATRKDPTKEPALMQLKDRYGDNLRCIKMDVTSDWEVEQAAKQIKEQYYKIDFLINNAGVMYESKYDEGDIIKDFDIQMLKDTLEVNTIAPVRVLKYFIDMLYESERALILNITSEAAHLEPTDYHYPAYGMSKCAANMYTQKIWNYVRIHNKNLAVYMIHPGRMDTIMGKENAQIMADEAAEGIWNLLEHGVTPDLLIPFVNYKGEKMEP